MSRNSLFSEFLLFLKENKLWWMLPILLVFALIAGILALATLAPAAAPFIYTLF